MLCLRHDCFFADKKLIIALLGCELNQAMVVATIGKLGANIRCLHECECLEFLDLNIELSEIFTIVYINHIDYSYIKQIV